MRRVLLLLVALAAVSVALGLWLYTPRTIKAGPERPAPTTSAPPRPTNPDPSQTPLIPSNPSLDKNEGMGVLTPR
jgi:hypothetical protein